MRGIASTLAENGIYTLVDFHQDAMGARFCGEGFPDWAVLLALNISGFLDVYAGRDRFPAPHPWDMALNRTTGMPARTACSSHPFFAYYQTSECEAAWAAVYVA